MHFMWICRVLPYLEKNDSTGRVVDKLAARCRCRRMWLADGRGRFVCHQRPRRWGCCGNAVASAVGAERWTGDGALSPVAESTFNGRFSSCCAVQCRASVTSRVPLCVCVCVCARPVREHNSICFGVVARRCWRSFDSPRSCRSPPSIGCRDGIRVPLRSTCTP